MRMNTCSPMSLPDEPDELTEEMENAISETKEAEAREEAKEDRP
jgi:hypothetical protein